MKINKDISAKLNIIKQINEDLERLQVNDLRLPEVEDQVTLGTVTKIDGTHDDGTDVSLVLNTKVPVTYDGKTIDFNYRRLSLEHIKTHTGVTGGEEGVEFNALRHKAGSWEHTPDYENALKKQFADKWEIRNDEPLVVKEQDEDKEKGVMTLKVAADDTSILYAGEAPTKVRTRETDVGVLTDTSNNVVYFHLGDTHSRDVKEIYLPYGATELPYWGSMAAEYVGESPLKIPPNVTRIKENGLGGLIKDLTKVAFNEKLTTLDANAFKGATTEEYTVPDHITSIGDGALGNVTTLKASSFTRIVDLLVGGAAKSVTKYVNTAVEETAEADTNHDTHGEVTFTGQSVPVYFKKDDVRDHKEYFDNDQKSEVVTAITKLVLPKDMTEIPEGFLKGSINLTELDISSVTSIKDNAFSNATITTLTVGESLDEVLPTAFTGATITTVKVKTEKHKEKVKELIPNLSSAFFDVEQKTAGGPELPKTVESAGFTYE